MTKRYTPPGRYKKKRPKHAAAPYRSQKNGGNNGGGASSASATAGGAAAEAGDRSAYTPSAAAGTGAPKGKRPLYFPPERNSLWPSEVARAATRPYRIVNRNWRQEIPHILAVFFLVLLLYYFTTPHKVTLEDDGLFIANLKFFGVAHPPGYPVHTFLGGLFYHLLPFGSPAFKGHFFSGFAGAVAAAAIYAAIVMLVHGRVFGYLGGLAAGAGKTFWSQAIIAEVYTLNAAFFFIVLALCIRYAAHHGRATVSHNRLLLTIAFVYGVGAANHYPILGLGTSGLLLLVLSQLGHILPNAPKAVAMALLGLVPPYLWMVWRSYAITPANFYGPIETLDQFWFYFLRSGYSGVDKQEGVGLEDKLVFAEALGTDMLWQFTPVGFFFVVIGIGVLLASRYSWLAVSLLASWFTSSVLLVYLLDFKASFIWLAAFRVYHLLAFGIMAIWLAVGAAWVVDRLRFLPAMLQKQMGGLIVLVVVGFTVASHWEVNNRSDYHWAHDLAMAKINSVEPNAVLFTFDDLDLPVGYLHFVEDVRPDLKVYNDQGLVYGDRLFSPLTPDYPPPGNANAPNKAAILRQFIDTTDRPIYYHPARRSLYQHPRYGSDTLGFLRRVNREDSSERVILSDYLRQWLDANVGVGDTITDLWTKQQHYSTVSQLVGTILNASQHGFPLDDQWQEVIERAREKNTLARLVSNTHLIYDPQTPRERLEAELQWAEALDPTKDELLSPKTRSDFYALYATLYERLRGEGDGRVEEILLDGVAQHDGADNSALPILLNNYYRDERYCDFIRIGEQFYPNTTEIPKNLLRQLRRARQNAPSCLPTVDDSDGEDADADDDA